MKKRLLTSLYSFLLSSSLCMSAFSPTVNAAESFVEESETYEEIPDTGDELLEYSDNLEYYAATTQFSADDEDTYQETYTSDDTFNDIENEETDDQYASASESTDNEYEDLEKNSNPTVSANSSESQENLIVDTISASEEPMESSSSYFYKQSKCGNDIIWTLSGYGDDLTLDMNGSGPMWGHWDSINETYNGEKVDWSAGWPVGRLWGSRISKVNIDSSITFLNEFCFAYLDKITEISIPESVESIGQYAFQNCYSLKSIIIPAGIQSIETSTFCYCYALEDVSLPDSLTVIGMEAFSHCKSLTNIILPKGIESVKKQAFSDCKSLKSITLPASITSIADDAFRGCENVTIRCPENASYVISYAQKHNIPYEIYYPNPISLKNADITGITDKTYTGSEIKQNPVVKLKNIKLELGKDYYLAYKNNVNVGKATIAIKGKGKYNNVAVRYFNVKAASVTKANIENIVPKICNGKALTQSPVVKFNNKVLKLNADYYLAYKNNINTGRATIAIKGMGNFTGVAVRYFAVKPKANWIDKLTSPKTKQITIKWGKRPQISGYQIQISTNKDFSKPKMQKNVYDPEKLSMTITVSKAKTLYYIRIRTFKKTKDKTYFSAWSATKSIITK